jgi:hypothetical protein
LKPCGSVSALERATFAQGTVFDKYAYVFTSVARVSEMLGGLSFCDTKIRDGWTCFRPIIREPVAFIQYSEYSTCLLFPALEISQD